MIDTKCHQGTPAMARTGFSVRRLLMVSALALVVALGGGALSDYAGQTTSLEALETAADSAHQDAADREALLGQPGMREFSEDPVFETVAWDARLAMSDGYIGPTLDAWASTKSTREGGLPFPGYEERAESAKAAIQERHETFVPYMEFDRVAGVVLYACDAADPRAALAGWSPDELAPGYVSGTTDEAAAKRMLTATTAEAGEAGLSHICPDRL